MRLTRGARTGARWPRRPARGLWRQLLPTPTTRLGAVLTGAYYALYLVPVGVGVAFDASRLYWLISGLASATVVVRLCQAGAFARIAALAVNAVSTVVNMLLMISLAFQEQGFNAQFFYHMDWETVVVGWDVFGSRYVVGGCYLVLVGLWPRLLPESGDAPVARAWTPLVAVLMALAILLNASVLSFAWHITQEVIRSNGIVLVPKPKRAITPSGAERPRNLVLIAAESLEATYGREDIFGEDLTPELTALATEGLAFTDVRQVSHTGWTMGGLIAASCAVPMRPKDFLQAMTRRADARMPGAVCLGDVLAAEDYRTVLMVGHPITFADIDGFATTHGIAEMHGFEALSPKLPEPSYLSGWGLYDDSLFALAQEKLAELDSDEKPFALVLMTMDTHFPPGHPSASCGPRADPADRAFVIRCADRLIAAFVRDVRAAFPEAVVALFSDHLSRESPRRAGLLRRADEAGVPPQPLEGMGGAPVLGFFARDADNWGRRLRFTIWDRLQPAAAIDEAGTHFDIMPTVFDVMGLDGWAEHEFGVSLLRSGSPWLARPDPDSLQRVYDLPGVILHPGATVTFRAQGPTIEIGDARILATGRGLDLDDDVFALAFARDGSVSDVLDKSTFEAMRASRHRPLVIGVSSNAAVNRELLDGDAAALVYFAGHVATEAFTAARLGAPRDERTIRVPGGLTPDP